MTWQKIYANPLQQTLHDNPRVKGWVKTLLENQQMLEKASGGWKLGTVLGCGHWGCVVDLLDSPWVLKLTVDPTEAHIWSKIVHLTEEERYGDDGFPRIKKIFKLEPGIPYGAFQPTARGLKQRTRTAYGIVREKVAPVFNTSGWQAATTPFTAQVLGVQDRLGAGTTESTLREEARRVKNHKLDDFLMSLEALVKYRDLANQYHGRGPYVRYAEDYRQEVLQRISRVLDRMSGATGGPLGESLQMLASNGVVLADVHYGNIGWRFLPEVEGEEGYTCLVVFDPGHTPTDKRQLPQESWIQLAQLC